MIHRFANRLSKSTIRLRPEMLSLAFVPLCLSLSGCGDSSAEVEFASLGDQNTVEPVVIHVNDEPGNVAAEQQEPIDFSRDILPILSNSCFHCHGPDQDSKEAKEAGFRLDDREDAIAMFAIVPGDAEESSVIDRVTTTRSSMRMPPLESTKPQLTPEQVKLLKRWINEGAEYSDHWSFVKPTKPELPEVSDTDWPTNAIDYFIHQKLEQKGLTPMPEAEKRRLIRRVSLDLIGLPPTAEEVEAFMNDTSPQAYEKLVDRLLASEHFGEHWARQWLDKARYADSQGYEKDRPRTMWLYRDWVINAYNRDVPFDQFTIEQLAGDLLDEPTQQQLIATGFHRNTMTNTEGGTDDEEFRAAAIIDRTNTTMEVWMGLTMACAQCHTHKYDPLYHEEYFQIYAFFNQTADADRYNDAPFIRVPTPKQQARLAELDQKIATAGEDATKLEELKKQRQQVENRSTTALVMEELPENQHRETYLFKGGSFLAPDKERGIIEPGVPEVFHDFPEDAPNNRLGLAQWLVHPDNPLTARVQVNRVWEQLFGMGLVETSNDFGFQGSYPTNKPLLDYLAVIYQEEMDWSTKSLIKMMVMSSAYRQSSKVSAERLEIDPFNKLVSRGPRLRLSAEQIRDQALYVAGILRDDEIGGPSVMPYVPAGMLPQAFDNYVQETSGGEDVYRRGLYTAWRRTGHYPSFATFDAPDRTICTVKRTATNTPLQALVTLNDPVYVEAAQGLGRLLIETAGDDIEARIELAFERALARKPTDKERTIIKDVYQQALADYQENTEAALKMATDPRGPLPEGMDVSDAAAMTVVGNVILNLDEFLNKP